MLDHGRQELRKHDEPADRALQELKCQLQERLGNSIIDNEALLSVTDRLRSMKQNLNPQRTLGLTSTPASDDSESGHSVMTYSDSEGSSTTESKKKIEELEELLLGQQLDFDAQIDLLLEDNLDLKAKLSVRDGQVETLATEVEEEKRKVRELLNETW